MMNIKLSIKMMALLASSFALGGTSTTIEAQQENAVQEDQQFWDRLLNSYEYSNNVPMQPYPAPVPAPVPTNCDDKNACTVDTIDPIKGCIHTPVACGQSEACDKISGTCVAIDKLRPCIAVIDESDKFSDIAIDAKWAAFRANFPDRFFCLLQPFNPASSRIYFPTNPDFLSDPRVTFAKVNRDAGDPALASDWLTTCGYDDFSATGIDFIGLFVDESGSMYRSTVQASLDKLDIDLADAGLTYCSVFNPTEDWITPFDTTLGAIGGGGACDIAP
jgi:hypothetical protein